MKSIAIIAIAILFSFAAASAEDLTADQIRALAREPDDRSKIPAALKFYPVA